MCNKKDPPPDDHGRYLLHLSLAAPHDYYDETTRELVAETEGQVGKLPGFPKSYEVCGYHLSGSLQLHAG